MDHLAKGGTSQRGVSGGSVHSSKGVAGGSSRMRAAV
jgi:hypothetical protein